MRSVGGECKPYAGGHGVMTAHGRETGMGMCLGPKTLPHHNCLMVPSLPPRSCVQLRSQHTRAVALQDVYAALKNTMTCFSAMILVSAGAGSGGASGLANSLG